MLGVQPDYGRFFHASDEHGPNSAPVHVAKAIFCARQQDIRAPDFLRRQILPIRLENIPAVQFWAFAFLSASSFQERLFWVAS